MDIANFQTFRGKRLENNHSRRELLLQIAELQAQLRCVYQRQQMLAEANKILNKAIVNNNMRNQERNASFLTHLCQRISRVKPNLSNRTSKYLSHKTNKANHKHREDKSGHKRVYTQQSNDQNDYLNINSEYSEIGQNFIKQKMRKQSKWND